MKHTLPFLFSLVLVMGSFSMNAQSKKNDSIPPVKTNRYGVRVGIDLFKLTRAFYEKDYRGLEVVGDYRISKRVERSTAAVCVDSNGGENHDKSETSTANAGGDQAGLVAEKKAQKTQIISIAI